MIWLDGARLGLVALSVIGSLDALYFVLVTYGKMRPDPRWLPNVCSMDERTCARIVHTPQARVFGLPNSVYGLAWCATVGVAAFLPLPAPALLALLGASGFTVLFSLYLFFLLVARLKVLCPLCILGHVINYAIFALLLVVCRGAVAPLL